MDRLGFIGRVFAFVFGWRGPQGSVTVTSPQQGQQVSGTISVTATFSGSGFKRARLIVDGVINSSTTAQPIRFTLNTEPWADQQTHRLTVRVDAKQHGHTYTFSSSVDVPVYPPDNSVPVTPPSPWTTVLQEDFTVDGVLPSQWGAYNFANSNGFAAGYYLPSHIVVSGGTVKLRQAYETTGPAGAGWYQAAMFALPLGPWISEDHRLTMRLRITSTGGIGAHRNLPLWWPSSENFSPDGEEDWFESDPLWGPNPFTYLHFGTSNSFIQVSSWPFVDLTQWHIYRFERKNHKLTIYVDDMATPIINQQLSSTELPDALKKPVFQIENPNYQQPAGTTGSDVTEIDYITIEVPANITTIDDQTTGTGNNQFNFSGAWTGGSDPGAYMDTEHHSATTNDFYTVQFTGVQAKVYCNMGINYGIAAVSIDGGAETNVDCYVGPGFWGNRQHLRRIYASPTLTNGTHTIKVRVTGTKNAASSANTISADRVDVLVPES